MDIRRVPADDPQLALLIESLDAELRSLYGDLQDSYDGLNLLPPEAEAFLLSVEGQAAACACLKPLGPGEGEVKRVYVAPAFRGRGFARALMSALEARAREGGMSRLLLETGSKQLPAIALYEGLGYERITNYGDYTRNENSVCMAKGL